MKFRGLNFLFVALIYFCAFLSKAAAQTDFSENHLEVTMRMIGHKVLLLAGDSTSRVLPVQRENNKRIIQFDTEFSFNPDDLKHAVDSILGATDINTAYILEVQQCQTGEIFYSYEISKTGQSDIIPCRSRDQVRSCYNILLSFTSIETDNSMAQLPYYILAILVLLIVISGIYAYRRRRSGSTDHIIQLGKYRFDLRNSTLILREQKTELSGKEANLLLLFINALNTTVERDEILQKVWGDEGDYIGRTLDVFISKLRKKLEADPSIQFINVRGVGYKLVVDR